MKNSYQIQVLLTKRHTRPNRSKLLHTRGVGDGSRCKQDIKVIEIAIFKKVPVEARVTIPDTLVLWLIVRLFD